MLEVSYTFTRASPRRAGLVWLWHTVGLFLFGALVVSCACLMYLVSALRLKGRAVTGPVTIRLTDAGIETSSKHGESLTHWTGVARVTLTKEFVFVRRRDSLEVALLRAPLGPEGVALLQPRAGAGYPDFPPA
jgi:hypothetical protein